MWMWEIERERYFALFYSEQVTWPSLHCAGPWVLSPQLAEMAGLPPTFHHGLIWDQRTDVHFFIFTCNFFHFLCSFFHVNGVCSTKINVESMDNVLNLQCIIRISTSFICAFREQVCYNEPLRNLNISKYLHDYCALMLGHYQISHVQLLKCLLMIHFVSLKGYANSHQYFWCIQWWMCHWCTSWLEDRGEQWHSPLALLGQHSAGSEESLNTPPHCQRMIQL